MKITIDFEKKTVGIHEDVSAKELLDKLIQIFGEEGLSGVVIEKVTKETVKIERVVEIIERPYRKFYDYPYPPYFTNTPYLDRLVTTCDINSTIGKQLVQGKEGFNTFTAHTLGNEATALR